MNSKIILLLIFSLFSIILTHAQETIVDSIYTTWELDGTIFYRESTQQLEVNVVTGNLYAGDIGLGPNADPNSRYRSFISFELPIIPDDYSIDSVLVRLKQYHSYGNGEQGIFPIWNVAGGDTMFCVMDHIDYGNNLDINDWTAGDIDDPQTLTSNIGIISDNSDYGFHYLDITEPVLEDYDHNRNRTQFRIRFPVETDWDYLSDWVLFGGNSGYVGAPTIFVYYKQNNNVNENLQLSHSNIKVYPNPFNPSTTIKLELAEAGKIKLAIYNIKGQKVKTLLNCTTAPGTYECNWNGKDETGKSVSSGQYVVKLKQNGNETATKIMLLK